MRVGPLRISDDVTHAPPAHAEVREFTVPHQDEPTGILADKGYEGLPTTSFTKRVPLSSST